MGCLGTWQIVGMLHGNENGLENQDSLLKDKKTGVVNVVLLLQLLFTTVVDLIIWFFVLKKISAKLQNRRKCQILIEKEKNLKLIT